MERASGGLGWVKKMGFRETRGGHRSVGEDLQVMEVLDWG